MTDLYSEWRDFYNKHVSSWMSLEELRAECGKLLTVDNPSPEVLLIHAMHELEALQAEVERLRELLQSAFQRGHQSGARGLREMYDAVQEVKSQDAWDNTRLTEALMAAEERAERAEAENKRLRAAFENLANLRASDIKKEKDAFELWITSKHPGANLSPYQSNCGVISSTDYMHPKVQAAWDAWLARAALSKENSND